VQRRSVALQAGPGDREIDNVTLAEDTPGLVGIAQLSPDERRDIFVWQSEGRVAFADVSDGPLEKLLERGADLALLLDRGRKNGSEGIGPHCTVIRHASHHGNISKI